MVRPRPQIWAAILRLASPAERWGGFGTCVRSKATGPHSSPTPEAQPSNDSDNGAARQDIQQKGLSLPRRSPGAATGQPPCASLTDSDLLTPSGKAPNTGGIFTTQNRWALTQTCYFPRSKIGCHPPTRIRLPPTRTRIRPGMPRLTALLARHVPINSTRTRSHTEMTTPQFHRVPSQDTHTKSPASTDRHTVSRPLGSGDQTDLSTKAATRPTVWGHYPHEPRPS